MSDTPQLLLEHHLKTLRLPTVLREYGKVARQCVQEKADFPNYLLRLTELELLDRERRSTRSALFVFAHLIGVGMDPARTTFWRTL